MFPCIPLSPWMYITVQCVQYIYDHITEMWHENGTKNPRSMSHMVIYANIPPTTTRSYIQNDDVIKWKHFPRYWPFVRGIYRSPLNSPHKGQWRGAFMFSLICTWINGWVNNREAGVSRCHRAHYDVIVMKSAFHVSHGYKCQHPTYYCRVLYPNAPVAPFTNME